MGQAPVVRGLEVRQAIDRRRPLCLRRSETLSPQAAKPPFTESLAACGLLRLMQGRSSVGLLVFASTGSAPESSFVTRGIYAHQICSPHSSTARSLTFHSKPIQCRIHADRMVQSQNCGRRCITSTLCIVRSFYSITTSDQTSKPRST